MSHLGVYLNIQEYDQMYGQFPENVVNEHGIHYSSFLSMLGVKVPSLFQNQKVNVLRVEDTRHILMNLDAF